MNMFSDFNATLEHSVQTICDSSISGFKSNDTSISFSVTGEDGTEGFCRVCIPTALMNATYRVFVNGTEVQCNLLPCSNSSYSDLYFTDSHSTKEIVIIPELASLIILPLFMVGTLIIVKPPTQPEYKSTPPETHGRYGRLAAWIKTNYGSRFREDVTSVEVETQLTNILGELEAKGAFKKHPKIANGFRAYISERKYGDLVKVSE